MALPDRLFCDTSDFCACLDPQDANHDRAEELTADAVTSAATLVTNWDIISETLTLLRYGKGFRSAVTFLDEVKPSLTIVDYGQRVRDEAEHIFRRRGRSRRVSFCDVISLVVVRTVLNDMPCLAFDQDFRALGLTVIS